MQIVFKKLGFAEISDEEVQECVLAHGSKDIKIKRDINEDLKAAKRIQDGEFNGVDIVKALIGTEWQRCCRFHSGNVETARVRRLPPYIRCFGC